MKEKKSYFIFGQINQYSAKPSVPVYEIRPGSDSVFGLCAVLLILIPLTAEEGPPFFRDV